MKRNAASALVFAACVAPHLSAGSAGTLSGPPMGLKAGEVRCTLPPVGKGMRECYYLTDHGNIGETMPYQFYVKGDFEVGWDHAFGNGHLVILVGEYANYPQVPLDSCRDEPVDISGHTIGSHDAVCTKVLKNKTLYLIQVWAGAKPGTGYINADPRVSLMRGTR